MCKQIGFNLPRGIRVAIEQDEILHVELRSLQNAFLKCDHLPDVLVKHW